MHQLHFLPLSEKPEVGRKIQHNEQQGEKNLVMDLFTSRQDKTAQAFQFNWADEPMCAGGDQKE